MDYTTEENNLKGRVEALEEILARLDRYLDVHQGICRDSTAHREIKMYLGKTLWGERVVYQAGD
jgi:hypothetical protein